MSISEGRILRGTLRFFIIAAFMLALVANAQPEVEYCRGIVWDNVIDSERFHDGNIYWDSYKKNITGIQDVCIIMHIDRDYKNFRFAWRKEINKFSNLYFYINNSLIDRFSGSEWESKSYGVENNSELKWVFNVMATGIGGQAWIAFPITPQPQIPVQPQLPKCEILAPNSICIMQPDLIAATSEIRGANYNWSITGGGEILSGQGTSQIKWRAGDNTSTINVNFTQGENKSNCSKNILINSSCIYLDYCDDLNQYIRNDTDLYLSCNSCDGGRIGYGDEGKVLIEGKQNLAIRSSCTGARPKLEGSIEVDNSSDIIIEGLQIDNNDGRYAINTDKLNNSYIINNDLISRNRTIFLYDSYNNIVYNNRITALETNVASIIVDGGLNNSMNNSYNNAYIIIERIYPTSSPVNNGSPNCINCSVNSNIESFACKNSSNRSCDIRNYTQHKWIDLDELSYTPV
jgi:hypothetical protein